MSTAPSDTPSQLRVRLGWAVAAIAAVLTAVSLFFAVTTLVFALRSGQATGEVIALETARDAQGQVKVPVEYQAVIEFPDHNGQFRRFTDASTTTTPPAIGSEVKVLFDRKRPSKARMEDMSLMYREALTAGVWALAIGIVAEELVRGARRPRAGVPAAA
ncbi:DUF3592 domain-containing protein [Mariniluteicoccus flavus]